VINNVASVNMSIIFVLFLYFVLFYSLFSSSFFLARGTKSRSYCKFHSSVRIYSAVLDCQHSAAEMDIV
jgi:hypothetical protein